MSNQNDSSGNSMNSVFHSKAWHPLPVNYRSGNSKNSSKLVNLLCFIWMKEKTHRVAMSYPNQWEDNCVGMSKKN
jgi:hypothetical protein